MLKVDKRNLKRFQKVWEVNPDGLKLNEYLKLMMKEI
jgi:hypothetical protein